MFAFVPQAPPNLPLSLVLTYTSARKRKRRERRELKKKIRLIFSENSGKVIPPPAALRLKMTSVGDGPLKGIIVLWPPA